MLYRVIHTAPRRPSTLAPLTADLDLVLAVGLAKDPADRYATAAELAMAVADALAHCVSDTLRIRGRALDEHGAWSR